MIYIPARTNNKYGCSCMRQFIVLALFLAFIIIPSHAIVNTVCLTNQTLQINESIYVNVNGNLTSINLTEELFCPLGCSEDSGACSDYNTFSIVTIGLSAIAFMFAFIALRLKSRHDVLQLMFFLFSILIVIADISLMSKLVATEISNVMATVQLMVIIGTILTIAYFMLSTIVSHVRATTERKQKEQSGEGG